MSIHFEFCEVRGLRQYRNRQGEIDVDPVDDMKLLLIGILM